MRREERCEVALGEPERVEQQRSQTRGEKDSEGVEHDGGDRPGRCEQMLGAQHAWTREPAGSREGSVVHCLQVRVGRSPEPGLGRTSSREQARSLTVPRGHVSTGLSAPYGELPTLPMAQGASCGFLISSTEDFSELPEG